MKFNTITSNKETREIESQPQLLAGPESGHQVRESPIHLMRLSLEKYDQPRHGKIYFHYSVCGHQKRYGPP